MTNQNEWPQEELEYISMCPVCTSKNSRVLHKHLVDNVFNCAPGEWTLYSCKDCKSAYLNPRPTRDSIKKAYKSYYTHKSVPSQKNYKQLTPIKKIKRTLVNGYKNWRFGSAFHPSIPIGILIMYLLPDQRLKIDRSFRNLPKLSKVDNQSLLDVGFGSGEFLEKALSLGWQTTGVDVDEMVVESAKKRDLDVYLGSIDVLKDSKECFDVITLNNVIEHLYDPIETLNSCYRLLKPGGMIWLETPNIFSYGHDIYRGNWRGIETPRHLVIFNHDSLSSVLKKTGFEKVVMNKRPSTIKDMFRQSEELGKMRGQKITVWGKLMFQMKVKLFRVLVTFTPNKREFITVHAHKPKV